MEENELRKELNVITEKLNKMTERLEIIDKKLNLKPKPDKFFDMVIFKDVESIGDLFLLLLKKGKKK